MAITFEARLPGTPLSVSRIRREMTAIAADCGMDAEGIADVRLAVSEATTNAVIHAYAETPGELAVTAHRHDHELEIVIADTGPGLVERTDSPGLGVGLSVIATLAQDLRIISHPGGTAIHMTFPCPNSG